MHFILKKGAEIELALEKVCELKERRDRFLSSFQELSNVERVREMMRPLPAFRTMVPMENELLKRCVERGTWLQLQYNMSPLVKIQCSLKIEPLNGRKWYT